jgi:hypothetical protein
MTEMIYWWSASKNCFFSNAFTHPNKVPYDAVQLSPEEYNYLISQNQRGVPIVSVNGKPQLQTKTK